jgi:radical SAM superfamily enzyme YgiQ (UPF0313 family)
VDQVLKEVKKLRDLKVQYITFSDANYIGNTKYAERLTNELARFRQENDCRMSFACQATLNLARQTRILGLMQKANFESVFIGIESPRVKSLLETKKHQNAHDDISEAISKN